MASIGCKYVTSYEDGNTRLRIVKCLGCDNSFGLDSHWLEMTREDEVHLKCPCCGHQWTIVLYGDAAPWFMEERRKPKDCCDRHCRFCTNKVEEPL
jgi:hypothetical protein